MTGFKPISLPNYRPTSQAIKQPNKQPIKQKTSALTVKGSSAKKLLGCCQCQVVRCWKDDVCCLCRRQFLRSAANAVTWVARATLSMCVFSFNLHTTASLDRPYIETCKQTQHLFGNVQPPKEVSRQTSHGQVLNSTALFAPSQLIATVSRVHNYVTFWCVMLQSVMKTWQ